MLHSVVTAVLAFAFAVSLGSRGANAATMSNDLYLAQFCIGCTSLVYDIIEPEIDRRMDIETPTEHSKSCNDYPELYCENFVANLSDQAEAVITKSVNAQLGSETSNFEISVEYRDENRDDSGCTDSEIKLRYPRRVHEECDNIEPNSDHLELISMLALTTVAVISFAVLADAWLLRRAFRNWQLRNMILRDKTTSGSPHS